MMYAFITYALLTLAIVALWYVPADARMPSRRAWLLLFGGSLIAAVLGGIVRPPGLIWIAGFAASAWVFSRESSGRIARVAAASVLTILAAGLMMHRLPGFNNPLIIPPVRFTPDAIPYRLHLNFDKTLAGIFLVGFCLRGGRSARAVPQNRGTLGATLTIVTGLILTVMVLSVALQYVRFAPKVPAETWLWLWANLCLTCFSEEALFRGFIQEHLMRAWRDTPHGAGWALLGAAILFGLAHAAGGPVYVALSTIAGIGYGWVYLSTGRLEASILAHFALNTVHFFFFSYPALERAAA